MMPGPLSLEEQARFTLSIAISSVLSHGARFIVAEDDTIAVRNPERVPFLAKQYLREHWPEARAEILRREHEIRIAESIRCSHCGAEIGRWIGHNLWVSGPSYHSGWGADNWRDMGQSLRARRCPGCGEHHVFRYRYRPDWGIAHW